MLTSDVLGSFSHVVRRYDPLESAVRVRAGRPSERLAGRRARIVFDAGDDGAWSIDVREGVASLARGRLVRPHVTVQGPRDVLVDILAGRRGGIETFLAGQISLRGNVALALELDDLFPLPNRDATALRCHRVDALGVRSFYLEAGDVEAPPVVLVHGLGATSASFLPTIDDLARDHRVVSVDVPGFGESDKPVRPLHAAYFAQWLVAFLDAVGIGRAHLIGNSMGGRIVLETALREPSRVARVALLAPSLAWRKYRQLARLVRLLRPELAFMPLPVLHAGVKASVRSMFARPERVSEAAVNGAADEFVRVFLTPRGRIAFFSALREIYLEDPYGKNGFWDRLRTLSRPTLFLFGDRDWLVPHGFARHVREAVPHATCEVLDDCGHVMQFEVPGRTHARIREFFAGDLRS